MSPGIFNPNSRKRHINGMAMPSSWQQIAVGMGCILINALKVDCNESSPSGITRTSSLIWACAQASLNPLMR